jgi:hypothetical protein
MERPRHWQVFCSERLFVTRSVNKNLFLGVVFLVSLNGHEMWDDCSEVRNNGTICHQSLSKRTCWRDRNLRSQRWRLGGAISKSELSQTTLQRKVQVDFWIACEFRGAESLNQSCLFDIKDECAGGGKLQFRWHRYQHRSRFSHQFSPHPRNNAVAAGRNVTIDKFLIWWTIVTFGC